MRSSQTLALGICEMAVGKINFLKGCEGTRPKKKRVFISFGKKTDAEMDRTGDRTLWNVVLAADHPTPFLSCFKFATFRPTLAIFFLPTTSK